MAPQGSYRDICADNRDVVLVYFGGGLAVRFPLKPRWVDRPPCLLTHHFLREYGLELRVTSGNQDINRGGKNGDMVLNIFQDTILCTRQRMTCLSMSFA